jgi:hypothetical protein
LEASQPGRPLLTFKRVSTAGSGSGST